MNAILSVGERVCILKIDFARHRQDTDGFKWDYTTATDDEIIDTVPVAQETIDGLSNIILKIVVPKQLPELRKQIAYLIGLRHRQAAAWKNLIADGETRLNNVKKWVQLHKA